ncbi:4-(cytidine 5'-diphospho)-2-C-methyl-D-erythritol kinase [Isachenkonia alkalipeptolytica]|uniref:4-diphosphocytidyl-2-C-methyl-D-erythritol kinase n=1 Tax=Isachenkonia alkalipeptolytica TaxID=2565777 RepID=A0AA44BD77_9CLOT|nr:4-(cytidine 5'-diphospho)-2-C-methyl-D-erythritol kinase [Isachenkonia alkalipeptolytica]NBG88049.1 4-(cytidine 5'-diphospho)-2-C-methyl-D-erythritol kinase [Isachenkonia alkalipeptolytica]
MEKIRIKTYGKINLYLEVIKKREDGYHDLQMVMQSIGLYDEVSLQKKERDEITLYTNSPYIPTDEGNIAVQAAKLMKEEFQIDQGVEISITKNIPVAAGLAGGSANAAGVLKGLNELWELKLRDEKLRELGLRLGADVPFVLMEGAAVAEGIGERLTPIEGLKNTWLVLCKPGISISTPEVYKALDLEALERRPLPPGFLSAIEKRDLRTLSKTMYNALESVTAKKHGVIEDIKKKMMQYNAIGAMMTGSGPTVFGIFKDQDRAKKAARNLRKYHHQTYVVNTYNK